MKKSAILLLLPLVAACALEPQNVKKFSRSVESGETVLLTNFAAWNSDCTARPFRLNVEREPAHGRIDKQPSTKKIGKETLTGKSSGCDGLPVASKKFLYTANPEFKGEDKVVLSISDRSRYGALEYSVNVY